MLGAGQGWGGLKAHLGTKKLLPVALLSQEKLAGTAEGRGLSPDSLAKGLFWKLRSRSVKSCLTSESSSEDGKDPDRPDLSRMQETFVLLAPHRENS